MPDALVAIDEGVVLDEREGKCGRLGGQIGIQIMAGEGHPWLSGGRFERTKIAEALPTAGLGQEPLMQSQNLAEGEVSHLGQAAVELAVLFQHTVRSALKLLGRRRDEVTDRCRGEIGHGNL